MSNPIFEKYRSLKPLKEDAQTNVLLQVLVDTSPKRLADLYGASINGGRFYLLRHDSVPGKVLEYVPDMAQDTSVTTLYAEHPIFESRQKLIEVREEIIREIEVLLLSIPGTMTVSDSGRGKEFHLFELGTAQLLDVLYHFSTH